jgi:hypothetical protein
MEKNIKQPFLNKYQRASIKHCIIDFYYDRKDEIGSITPIYEVQITNEKHLQKIVELFSNKLKDFQSLYQQKEQNYMTSEIHYFQNENPENTELSGVILNLASPKLIELNNYSLATLLFGVNCYSVSFPEWYYKQLL